MANRVHLWCVFTAALAAVLPSSLAAQTTPPATEGTRVDASRGGITISSGPNSLTIGARVQFRWTFDDFEDFTADTAGSGLGRDDGARSAFDVPRLRLALSGGMYRPWLRYAFQFELGRTSGQGASKIKDAILEIRPTGRAFLMRAGQFKAPFGLQQLTSSGRLQFVDRAITDAKFTPGRDMGIMAGGTVADRKVGIEAGIFNGSGESVRQNNRAHLWTGRIFVQPLGPYSLSEGASDAGDRAVLHAGAGLRGGKQIRGRTPGRVIEDPDSQTAANVELAFRAPRFFATAEHFWMTDEQENPMPGRDIASRGFHTQAGYMVLPRQVEVGVLYARVTPDTDISNAGLAEIRGVVGYYWQGHNLKLQADAGRILFGENFASLSARARQGLLPLGQRLSTGRSLADTQVRVQLQLAF